jgi:hypothetical protein
MKFKQLKQENKEIIGELIATRNILAIANRTIKKQMDENKVLNSIIKMHEPQMKVAESEMKRLWIIIHYYEQRVHEILDGE